jgi:hypothetical protein
MMMTAMPTAAAAHAGPATILADLLTPGEDGPRVPRGRSGSIRAHSSSVRSPSVTSLCYRSFTSGDGKSPGSVWPL